MLSLCRCQLRHIHNAYKNIETSILDGRRWHGIWWISWSPTMYWISLQLWRCVMWRAVWLLTYWGQLRLINDWIIQLRMHRYHWWWKLIALLVTVLSIKAPVIMGRCSLPTLLVPCSTFVATTNTLLMWKYEWNISLWWCCVPVIFLLMANRMWERTCWRDNCSCVWVPLPGIKLRMKLLSQYNPN